MWKRPICLRRLRYAGGAPTNHALARDLADWSARLFRNWLALHIGQPTVARADDCWRFSVPVFLGEMAADDIRVELYAATVEGEVCDPVLLAQERAIPGAMNGYIFIGQVAASRPANDFTVRIIPSRREALVPAELALIAWQR